MKRYLFVAGGVLFVLWLMWSNSSTRDLAPFANTVQSADQNVVIFDGNDPYFQWAGGGALFVLLPLCLLAIWALRPPKAYPWLAGASMTNAMFAAFVLIACMFVLNYLSHSGQAGLLTVLFDALGGSR